MDYEVVIKNEYYESLRLCYGVLVNIRKCKLGTNIYNYRKFTARNVKKVKDNIYELKEDFNVEDYNFETREYEPVCYKKGTKVIKLGNCTYNIIEEISDKKDWYWEIKTTSDCFSGDTEGFTNMIDTIKDIIDSE